MRARIHTHKIHTHVFACKNARAMHAFSYGVECVDEHEERQRERQRMKERRRERENEEEREVE